MKRLSYAFFDFDNTLARGDSIFSFMLYSLRNRKITIWHYLKSGYLYFIRNFKADINAKEFALSFLKDKTEYEIKTYCKRYVDDVLRFRLYREGIEEINRCRNSGMRIIIVSASVSMYMDLIKNYLHADDIICTQAIFKNGIYTGHVGKNCSGLGKTVRIQNYLDETGTEIDTHTSRGYGDLPTDLYMMRLTGEIHLVNPSPSFVRKCPEGIIHEWKEVVGK